MLIIDIFSIIKENVAGGGWCFLISLDYDIFFRIVHEKEQLQYFYIQLLKGNIHAYYKKMTFL